MPCAYELGERIDADPLVRARGPAAASAASVRSGSLGQRATQRDVGEEHELALCLGKQPLGQPQRAGRRRLGQRPAQLPRPRRPTAGCARRIPRPSQVRRAPARRRRHRRLGASDPSRNSATNASGSSISSASDWPSPRAAGSRVGDQRLGALVPPQMSRFCTWRARALMKSRRGSTFSPISVLNIRSASATSSMSARSRVRVAGLIVVSHS